jgi:hypothetical protein
VTGSLRVTSIPRPLVGEGAPRFLVSVASKGFSHGASLLFATLAGWSISVADKGFMWTRNVCTLERPNRVGICAPQSRWSFGLKVGTSGKSG